MINTSRRLKLGACLSSCTNQIKTDERYSVNLKRQNYWRKRREVLQDIGIGQDFLNTDSNSSGHNCKCEQMGLHQTEVSAHQRKQF